MKTITKEFAQKIIRNQGILETATYRYVYEEGSFRLIRKEYLDTTANVERAPGTRQATATDGAAEARLYSR